MDEELKKQKVERIKLKGPEKSASDPIDSQAQDLG